VKKSSCALINPKFGYSPWQLEKKHRAKKSIVIAIPTYQILTSRRNYTYTTCINVEKSSRALMNQFFFSLPITHRAHANPYLYTISSAIMSQRQQRKMKQV
jgi:hypothetical protein